MLVAGVQGRHDQAQGLRPVPRDSYVNLGYLEPEEAEAARAELDG